MSDLDDITTDVPSSSVELTRTEIKVPSMPDINSQIAEIYNFYSVDAQKAYKSGTTIKVSSDTRADQVIRHIITLYIDTIRQRLDTVDNEEERRNLQIQLKQIKTVLNGTLDLLCTEPFLLDINSVLHIIHGYVNNNVEKLFEDYEIRRRTTH